MRLLFAGTPEVAVPTLEALVEAGHDIVGVVTRPDAPTGRGRKLAASPVAERAAELGLDVYTPVSAKAPEFADLVRELAPDCCPVVAYGGILPEAVLGLPAHGWVNLHFSLLPRWRGAAPVQRALIAGDESGGVTTFEIVRELDAGPVYLREHTDYPVNATAGELLAELAASGAQTMVRTLELIEQGAVPTPQGDEGLTTAAKIEVDDARLDFAHSAWTLHNLVRGTSPDPGAWALHRDARLKILSTRIIDGPDLAPGELLIEKKRVLVGTGEGSLHLVTVQPQGKKPMGGADWGRGGISSGEVLA